MVVEVVPGQPYSPVFDITVTGHGTATVPGFSTMPGGEFVDLGGQLHFVGETFTPMGAGALFTSYSFPFTMTGEVWAFARNQPGSERLFTVQVTGSGISEVGPFRRFEDDQQVRYLNLQGTQTITFTPQQVPEPVPEPATVLLLGSGLAACWRGVRKRVVDRSSP